VTFIARIFRRPKLASTDQPVPTEAEVLADYRVNGDVAALGELYAKYMQLVYGVCLKYLREPEAAKDAVMQIFEKLVTTLRQHEVRNFPTWLHVMARNHCLMQLRAQARHPEQPLPEQSPNQQEEDDQNSPGFMEYEGMEHPPDSDPEAVYTALDQGVARLSPEQRQCIELFYLQEKPYKEISEITGHDLNKVKSYIQNGKRNLKIFLEQKVKP
jgi:RNA polymerase sigma factor (sigma-70 family)